MFKAKSTIRKAWDKLSKALDPIQNVQNKSDLDEYLRDYSISPTLIERSINSRDHNKTLLSQSVTRDRSRVRVNRQTRTPNQQSVSHSLDLSRSTILQQEPLYNPRLKIKLRRNIQYVNNLQNNELRSIPLQKLMNLYRSKCQDNDIIPTKDKLTQFLSLIHKRGCKRILDLSDLQLGFNGSYCVAQIIKMDSHFLQLILSGNDIPQTGWIRFSDTLQSGQNNSLLHIDLSKCSMTPLSLVHVLSSLSNINSLISLNISYNHLSKIGCEMLELFLIKNQTLLYLNLSSTQMGQGFESVSKGISHSKSLLTLDIANNDIDHRSMLLFTSQLSQYKDYEEDFLIQLNLEKNNLCQKGAEQLAQLLKWKNWQLNLLNLSSNNINGKGFQKIVEALISNHYLEKLILSRNNLKGEGFEYIIYLLQSNDSIKQLNISDCQIDTLASLSVGMALSKNQILLNLNISGNPLFVKGCVAIADGLANHKSLNILDISRSCQIRDQGASYLYEKLTGLQSFFGLTIKNNFLSDESFAQLKVLLTDNKNITMVEFSLNSVNYKLERDIQELLKINQDYRKDQIIPQYKKKLMIFGDLKQQTKQVILSQEKLEQDEVNQRDKLIVVQSLFSQTKAEEKIKMQQLQDEMSNKQEKLKCLTKIEDDHEKELYRQVKETEADVIFYEKNIDEQNKLSQYYQQFISQNTNGESNLANKMVKTKSALENTLYLAKTNLEIAQIKYLNISQKMQSLKNQLSNKLEGDIKPPTKLVVKGKQKQQNSRNQ